MKFRTGFVSNSSNSSFIIALATVADLDKLQAWLSREKITFRPHEGGVFNIFEKESSYPQYPFRIFPWKNDFCLPSLDEKEEVKLSLDSILATQTKRPAEVEAKELLLGSCANVFAVRIFNSTDEDLEDITFESFPKWQQKLFEGLTEKHGLAYVDKKYGAGRNG
jgi:hypothetical protein